MPNFGIIYTDLKSVMKEKAKDLKSITKISLKKKTDTGLKKNDEDQSDEEQKTKAGATFDPKTFNGNSDIYKHTTDFQLSML